jgi:serine/threonine protein kinase
MIKYYPNSTSQNSKPVQKPPKQAQVKFETGGTVFVVDDRYEYVKQIGHGAYGVVCSAFDKRNNRKVAIKKVTNAFQDLIDAKRILREVRLLSSFVITQNI